MKKLLACLLVLLIVGLPASAKQTHVPARIKGAKKTIERMIRSKFALGLADSVRKSLAVVIFPDVVKAGLIFGGRYGEALILRRDRNTGAWYGPAFFSIGGGSFGLQIGASSTALVLTVSTEKGLQAFRSGSFTIGADVTATAGPGGKESYVGTTINAKALIYSYSISRGVFAGFALDGSAISSLSAANDACWGQHLSNVGILNKQSDRADVKSLIAALNRLIAIAK